jgi:uncharacterized membrane protein
VLIGIAMIVGMYYQLNGWWLLLATIPASIIALIIALFFLALEKKNEPQKAPGAAPDSYA